MSGVVLLIIILVGGFIAAKKLGLLAQFGRKDSAPSEDWPVYEKRLLSPIE